MSDNIFDPNELDLDLDNLENSSSKKSSKQKKDDNISISEKNTSSLNSFSGKEEEKDNKINEEKKDIETSENTEKNNGQIYLEKTKSPKKEEKKEIDEETIKRTLTDKSLLPEEIRKKEKLKEMEARRIAKEKELNSGNKKIIFDINIEKVSDLTKILIENKYDFFTIEPTDTYAKITFFKNNINKEERYIKLPEYFSIITEAKKIAKLKTDTTHLEQKGSGEINNKDDKYEFITKIVPGDNGEKVFVKVKLKQKKAVAKKKEPVSLAKAFSYLGIILFIIVLLAGIFLSFVLFNSDNVAQLNFFKDTFGIDANNIKAFIKQLVSVVFMILVFIETIFFASFVFKAFLAKKDKSKRIAFSVLSTFLAIILMITLFTWITLVGKIQALKGYDYGKTIAYDNDMLISKIFDKKNARLENLNYIIGPVSVEFDISEFIKQVKDENITPTKVLWNFGDGKTIDLSPNITKKIHKYTKKGVKRGYIEVQGLDLKGNELKKPKKAKLQELNINYMVKIEEKEYPDGGKKYIFDGSNLTDLGDLEWIFVDNIDNMTKEEIYKAFDKAKENSIKSKKFYTKLVKGKILVALKTSKTNKVEKFFILDAGEESGITGDITYNIDDDNNMKYTFKVKNAKTTNGNGIIEKVIWQVSGDGDNTRREIKIPVNGNFSQQFIEKNSKFTYTFKKFGEKEIKAILFDSSGKQKTVDIIKLKLKQKPILKEKLKIFNENGEEIKTRYNEKINTYFIRYLEVPTKLIFDARGVTNKNYNYHLDSVEFDLDEDGIFETLGEKKVEKNFPIEKYYIIKIKYTFKHNISGKIEELIEKININAIAKDWLPHLEVKKSSEYAPSEVGFDASQSRVKGENIVEFAYDYGDGTPIDRTDAKVTHIYSEAGHYNVKLTVTTDKGNTYTTKTQVIIKPSASEVKISSSLNKAPVFQEIDFSSDKSTGNIASYYWNFGDGTTSTKANPSHAYKKPGKYKVTLTIIFANHNKKSNFKYIEITD